ncbi:hypothetical protein [Fodinicurvata sediminis]|uniref:hypothetical protein n=1 Tax=Fodinicurvata sediminis TaxID=1121832 RepID=UPI0003B5B108|nr:hypothetical protein [Fodinicurvata sediminis]
MEKKSRSDLEKLTKEGLEDYAKAAFEVDLDRRKTKADLVAEVVSLQLAESDATRAADAPDPVLSRAAEKGKTRLTIHSCNGMDPIKLAVNGRVMEFPLNKPVSVPSHALPTLEAAGAKFTKE